MNRLKERILFLIVLILVIFPTIGVSAAQNLSEINLQVASFEKAYCLVRDNWIFSDGHREILGRVLTRLGRRSDLPQPTLDDNEAKDFQLVKDYFRALCLNKPDRAEEYVFEATKGMLADLFSRPLSAKDAETIFNTSGEEYLGDGLEMTWQENKVLVILTHLNTPARTAGFMTGDEILAINGLSFVNLNIGQAEALFEKVPMAVGEELIYLARRDNQELILKTKIIKIGSPSYQSDINLKIEKNIGIIRIERFSLGIGQEFLKYLEALKKQGIDNLILDLRDNPGGFSGETKIIVKAMTGRGYRVKGLNFDYVSEEATIKEQIFNGRAAVLVNGNSASASEIVAACLQEYGIRVFGCSPTWGKNFGQGFYILPNRMIFLMSNHWSATMSGHTWSDGVQPDVLTKDDEESMSKAKEYLK